MKFAQGVAWAPASAKRGTRQCPLNPWGAKRGQKSRKAAGDGAGALGRCAGGSLEICGRWVAGERLVDETANNGGNVLLLLAHYVGVLLCHANGLMAQQLLDRAQVPASQQGQGGEGVAQIVEAEVLYAGGLQGRPKGLFNAGVGLARVVRFSKT